MSFWADGFWASDVWAVGFWESAAAPPIVQPPPQQLYGAGGAEAPRKRAGASLRKRILREDRELLEIISLFVLRGP